jgi:GDP-4-dehydro-6-deoxy-D-mannose reductase
MLVLVIQNIEAMKKIKSRAKILIPGSGEEYGLLEKKDMPITERTLINPVNPYAVSKVAQDYISYVYYKSFGVRAIRVRTFNHEGPRRENVFGISSYAFQIAKIEKSKNAKHCYKQSQTTLTCLLMVDWFG